MKHEQDKEARGIPLNPALKSEKDTVYETKVSSPAPIATTSASADDGKGWPVVWMVVTILGVLLAIYFLI